MCHNYFLLKIYLYFIIKYLSIFYTQLPSFTKSYTVFIDQTPGAVFGTDTAGSMRPPPEPPGPPVPASIAPPPPPADVIVAKTESFPEFPVGPP